jgi:DNA-binding NarL/FixJ family response regulator
VVATTNATAGLTDLVARHNPDVVILDVVIGLDGIDLIPTLHNEGIGPAVLVLTSDQSHHTATEAVRMGASAVVLKTAPISDLIVAIGAATRGEAWVSPPLLSGLLASLQLAPGPKPDRTLLNGLSPRELAVLTLMVEGFGQATIGKKLGLSVNTVRTHTHNLHSKLGVHSQVAAVAVALRAGLRPAER